MKGNFFEQKAGEELRKLFLFVEGPPVKTKWQRRDYFGMFDFLCVNDEGELTAVQVSNKYASQRDRGWKKAWNSWPGKKIYMRWEKKIGGFVYW